MSDQHELSEMISQLAENYDQQQLHDSEAGQVRALLQGALMGLANRELIHILKTDHIEQLTDGDGDYLPYFTVITEGGFRFRVTVDHDRI